MKHEISAGGIVYRKVEIINSNLDRQWLICQHSYHKGWVFAKGLVGDSKQNEPMEEAAIREVEEEGGVKAKIIAPLTKPIEYFYKFKGELIKKTVYYFLMEYIAGETKDHDEEMMDAKFVSAEKVRKTLSYKSDKEAFEEAVKLLKDIK